MIDSIKYNLARLIKNDKLYDSIRYFLKFRKFLDLKNPTTFNEKIIWKKLNDNVKLYSDVADKVKVREYVQSKNQEVSLSNIYYITDNPDSIDFDVLPNQFVVKASHGSGWVEIVRDKNKLNINKILKKCNSWLSRNYYYLGREMVYKDIKPNIIIEELLIDEDNNVPMDIKCFCFNGKVEFIQLDIDRYKEHKRVLLDANWNVLPFSYHYPPYKGNIERNKYLPEIIEISESLSSEFDFIRVDLYLVDNKVYFGELTNYPGCGFEKFNPKIYDEKFGKLITTV